MWVSLQKILLKSIFLFHLGLFYLFLCIYCLQYQMKMELQLQILTIFFVLSCMNAKSWQGTGNMSQSNMTIINNFISNNLNTSSTDSDLFFYRSTEMADLVTNFSNLLNELWDPAWNVFVTYNTIRGEDSDTVVYGYAFNNHWLWINGIKMIDNTYISFIIWKDYNCDPKNWFTLNNARSHQQSTFSNAAKSQITLTQSNFQSQAKYDDVWKTAFNFIEELTKSTNQDFYGKDKAFTIVMTQSQRGLSFARFCALNYHNGTMPTFKNRLDINGNNQQWGGYTLLRMR